MRQKTPPTKAKAKIKLDWAFSRFIRLRDTDDNGFACCFTCNKPMFWKHVDAGHFITRAKMATRWDERNVQFQCKQCNMTGGQQFTFGRNLEFRYGRGTADLLMRLSNTRADYTAQQMMELAEAYNRRANELLKDKGLG